MKRALILIGIAWIVAISIFVAYKENTLRTGTEVILQTAPIDPRDFFRGDYVILNYDISSLQNIPMDRAFAPGDTIYVSLQLNENIARAVAAAHEEPEGLFIKGKVVDSWQPGIRVEYGIESYFVPEGTGHEVERESNLTVKVAIDKSGHALIKHLLLHGEEVRFDQAAQ